jgi:hypothetical protein
VVIDRLATNKTKYYDQIRPSALTQLALALRNLDKETDVQTSHNLPQSPYESFVPRYDAERQKYYEVWIPLYLASYPSRVVTLWGPPGVGKTSLAYRIAELFEEKNLVDRIVWISSKRQAYLPLLDLKKPLLQPAASFDAILDTIGKEFGQRGLLNKPTEEKQNIVRSILEDTYCLIVLDNLESLDQEGVKQVARFLCFLPWRTRVIVTSRRRLRIPEFPIRLRHLSSQEGIRLIATTIRDEELPLSLTNEQKEKLYKATYGNLYLLLGALGRMARGESTIGDIRRIGQLKELEFVYGEMFEEWLDKSEQTILLTLALLPESVATSCLRTTTQLGAGKITKCLRRLDADAWIQRKRVA